MVIKNTIVKFLPAPVNIVRVVKSVRDRERHNALEERRPDRSFKRTAL